MFVLTHAHARPSRSRHAQVTLDDILALRGEKAERVDLSSNADLAKYNLQTLEDGTVELMPKEEGQA